MSTINILIIIMDILLERNKTSTLCTCNTHIVNQVYWWWQEIKLIISRISINNEDDEIELW